MATVVSFEEIQSWQKAKELSLTLYSATMNWKDYSMRSQMRRASVSVMNNIAEGFERQTNKDFRHFLFMAKGSCGEVRSMLHLVNELGYIDKETYKQLTKLCMDTSRLISGFIKTL